MDQLKKEHDEKKVILLEKEDSEKFNIELGYILIRCTHCYSSWGVTPINGSISKKAFICRNCAKEKIYQEMIDK